MEPESTESIESTSNTKAVAAPAPVKKSDAPKADGAKSDSTPDQKPKSNK